MSFYSLPNPMPPSRNFTPGPAPQRQETVLPPLSGKINLVSQKAMADTVFFTGRKKPDLLASETQALPEALFPATPLPPPIPEPIRSIRDKADAEIHRRTGKPRGCGVRHRMCGVSARVVLDEAKRLDLPAWSLEISDFAAFLRAHLQTLDTPEARELETRLLPQLTTGHTFAVVEMEGKPFLVDTTLGQFFKSQEPGRLVISEPEERELKGYSRLETLLTEAAIEATPETWAEFFIGMSHNDPAISPESLAEIFRQNPRWYDHPVTASGPFYRSNQWENFRFFNPTKEEWESGKF